MTHATIDRTLAVLIASEERAGRLAIASEITLGLYRLRQHDSFSEHGSYARDCIARYLSDGTCALDLPRIYAALARLDGYEQERAA